MDFLTTESGKKLSYILTLSQHKSPYLLIIIHGTCSSKDSLFLPYLSDNSTYNTLRFDFPGNGDSGGEFEFGGFEKEVSIIHSVVLWAKSHGYKPLALIGHSKAGNEVLMYSAKYGDVPLIISIAGRLDMNVIPAFIQPVMNSIEAEGQATIELLGREYNITKAGVDERKAINMTRILAAVRNWVCAIHGDIDPWTNIEDAEGISRLLGRRCFELDVIQGADHSFTNCEAELLQNIENFLAKAVPLLQLTHKI
ncbi:unnamed protein product [Blepharisma stoltei]|uniref:AB hydrolase-1 domain-containing protein n=1 Tax=Blepharisma stoltei TaxID=1481888 RepID=A0AAU9K0L6_9CILI|nr:unnamed protein product [Blepharisma stoltei]